MHVLITNQSLHPKTFPCSRFEEGVVIFTLNVNSSHTFFDTGPVHNMFRSEWKCFGFAWKCLNFPTTPGRFLPGMISVK